MPVVRPLIAGVAACAVVLSALIGASPPASGVTLIDAPGAPLIDECYQTEDGIWRSGWAIPADTAQVAWENDEDGHVSVWAKDGYEFRGGGVEPRIRRFGMSPGDLCDPSGNPPVADPDAVKATVTVAAVQGDSSGITGARDYRGFGSVGFTISLPVEDQFAQTCRLEPNVSADAVPLTRNNSINLDRTHTTAQVTVNRLTAGTYHFAIRCSDYYGEQAEGGLGAPTIPGYKGWVGPVTVPAVSALTAPTPAISGTARVGVALTAVPGVWSPAPVTLRFQWSRGGKAIAGATATQYVPVAADRGQQLSVTVTGAKAGYTAVARTSLKSAVVAAGVISGPTPRIIGTAKKGKKLTASPGTWKPSGVALTYQWRRNGAGIPGATKSTYKLVKKDKKKRITVTVTGSKPGYTTLSRTSPATAKVR